MSEVPHRISLHIVRKEEEIYLIMKLEDGTVAPDKE
jgi:hypothetical protein